MQNLVYAIFRMPKSAQALGGRSVIHLMNKKTSTSNKALVYVMQLKKDVSIRNNEDVSGCVYYAGLILEEVTHGSDSRGYILRDRFHDPFGYECALHGF